METVDPKKLLPAKFEPFRLNRWVMMIEGVDAFLVKTVEPPVIESISHRRELTIALYNIVGGDQNERLQAWLELPVAKKGELKFLDPVGTVVELWKFRAKPLKMWFDKLDYASAGLMATYVLLDLEDFDITTLK